MATLLSIVVREYPFLTEYGIKDVSLTYLYSLKRFSVEWYRCRLYYL